MNEPYIAIERTSSEHFEPFLDDCDDCNAPATALLILQLPDELLNMVYCESCLDGHLNAIFPY